MFPFTHAIVISDPRAYGNKNGRCVGRESTPHHAGSFFLSMNTFKMDKSAEVVVVGAGIFGVTAALELRSRGYDVLLLDEGSEPHPLASTTDISKIVRMEYGTDELYMMLVEEALPGFRRWNEEFGETLFHESGVLMLSKEEMSPGGFEYESYKMLERRGHAPERLDTSALSRRFPAWREGAYADGFYHVLGGFAESGRLLATLRRRAMESGIRIVDHRLRRIQIESGRVAGVELAGGKPVPTNEVIVAAGAWTRILVPELATQMRSSGHPVFHLRPPPSGPYSPPEFVTFTADVSRTGWYGFPCHPSEGVVKVAHHGTGKDIHAAADDRVVGRDEEERLRRFLAESLPALADAPILYRRLCLYCDTLDGHFLIDRHPGTEGLTIASGGSGHGFKFAPILGRLTADAFEGVENAVLERFRWRELPEDTRSEEAARYHG